MFKKEGISRTEMDILVYEHIEGLPDYLDTIHIEITECIIYFCRTIDEAEKEVENINKIQPKDKFGRKRNLYIYKNN